MIAMTLDEAWDSGVIMGVILYLVLMAWATFRRYP